jgi:hypothetical protein
LAARSHAGLMEQLLNHCLDGAFRDLQLPRDLLIGDTVENRGKNLLLPLGEKSWARGFCAWPLETEERIALLSSHISPLAIFRIGSTNCAGLLCLNRTPATPALSVSSVTRSLMPTHHPRSRELS